MTAHSPDIVELLEFYRDAGVAVALLDEPVDRFAAAASETTVSKSPTAVRAKSAKPATIVAAQGVSARLPDQAAIQSALDLASSATSLSELRSAIEKFEGCNLKLSARNTVFADGNPEADLMIIGEAPGRDEDAQGLPFVGRSGQLLDKMLAAIGLDRTSVYISNVIPWRPPGNRTPTAIEVELCKPFILRHIELAQPKVLMLVGGSSAKAMLDTASGIMSLRGKWRDIQISQIIIPAMPTLHPAYLLRQPAQKRLAWSDLQKVSQKLVR